MYPKDQSLDHFFLIYINDLPLEIKKSILDKFADDTTMSRCGTCVQKVTEDLNEDGEDSVNWCVKNKMSIKFPKTKAMFMTTAHKQSIIQESPPEIKINSTVIEISSKEKNTRSNNR